LGLLCLARLGKHILRRRKYKRLGVLGSWFFGQRLFLKMALSYLFSFGLSHFINIRHVGATNHNGIEGDLEKGALERSLLG